VPGNGDVLCETSFSRLTLTTTPLRKSMLAATAERTTLLALNWEHGWWTPNPDLKDDPKMQEIFKAVNPRSGTAAPHKRGREEMSAASAQEEEEARQDSATSKAARKMIDELRHGRRRRGEGGGRDIAGQSVGGVVAARVLTFQQKKLYQVTWQVTWQVTCTCTWFRKGLTCTCTCTCTWSRPLDQV
jgi:hypothetical protein